MLRGFSAVRLEQSAESLGDLDLGIRIGWSDQGNDERFRFGDKRSLFAVLRVPNPTNSTPQTAKVVE